MSIIAIVGVDEYQQNGLAYNQTNSTFKLLIQRITVILNINSIAWKGLFYCTNKS